MSASWAFLVSDSCMGNGFDEFIPIDEDPVGPGISSGRITAPALHSSIHCHYLSSSISGDGRDGLLTLTGNDSKTDLIGLYNPVL